MVKYSFIVPVFNCEDYLENCVDSILKQRCDAKFEVILVDDGSTDRSGALADELAGRNENVRSFHKRNGGAASARNCGIAEAQGVWILFIDGDDTIEPDLLQEVESALCQDENALTIFGISFDYYRNGHLERSDLLSCANAGSYSMREVFAQYRALFGNNVFSSACNKVFRLKTVREHDIRFPEGVRLYEDYAFVLDYLRYTDRAVLLGSAPYRYRHDAEHEHLNDRVKDPEVLQKNLSEMLIRSLRLTEEKQAPEVADVAANLYLQLLRQSLMTRSYTQDELQTILKYYLDESQFCKALAGGAKLSADNLALMNRVGAGDYSGICREYRRKRTISGTKRMIKAALRALGLRK